MLLALLFVSACSEQIDPEVVLNDTTPAELSITSPVAGSTVNTAFVITANAADPESRVVLVSFYTNGSLVNQVIASNLPATVTEFASTQIDVSTLPEGANVLKVVAVNGKQLTTTRQISVTISHGSVVDTTAPLLSIASPADGAALSGSFQISASALDDESGIASVSFYANGSLINTTAVPASGTLFLSSFIQATNLPEGSNALQVVAVNGKLLATTNTVTVTVSHGSSADTTPPQLAVVSPSAGGSYSNDFTISATASDGESGISSVSFYANGSLLSTASIPVSGTTYSSSSVSVDSLSEGANTITVVAKNGENLTTTNSISITVVKAAVEDTVTLTLAGSEPSGPTATFALDVLDPVFAWSNGSVSGVLSYRITVMDEAQENVYYWVENVPASAASMTYGSDPSGSLVMMSAVDLVSGSTYLVSIVALDVEDVSGSTYENEIGFAWVQFSVSGTRAVTRKSAARPISVDEYKKRLAALRAQ